MKTKIITLLLFISLGAKGDYWTQKADFAGTARAGAIYFSIGNKGYIGTGTDAYPQYNFRKDFWEYDYLTNSWTQKADFAGLPRYTAFGFSLGTKGYVGTGWNQVSPYFNDFWQYDQAANLWTQKGNFPGLARQGAVAAVVNNTAYAGMGANGNTILNDFYAYNEMSDTWTQVTNFPGAPRILPFGLGVNGKIYIGCGVISYPGFNLTNDFWEFDPLLNSWSQKLNFPGAPRFAMAYFQINGRVYAGIGKNVTNYFNDFYEYNPLTNVWIQKMISPVIGIEGGFTIGSCGYSGCGSDTISLSNKFWEYTPDSTTGIEEPATTNFDFQIAPNPFKEFITINLNNPNYQNHLVTISVTDVLGKTIFTTRITTLNLKLKTLNYPAGMYTIKVDDGEHSTVKKFMKE